MANDRRRIKSVLIGVVLGLWALLLGVAVVWGLQNAENDIESRVASALGEAGIGLDEIRVEGRDVFLAGIANEQRASAEQLVSSLRGVRIVEMNDLPDVVIVGGGSTTTLPGDSSSSTTLAGDPGGTTSSQAPTTVPPGVANISASLEKGVLKLSGAVPDQESAARIAALADLIYGPFVEGSVEVDPELESAAWVPNAARVISVLPIVSTSGVQIAGGYSHRERRGSHCRAQGATRGCASGKFLGRKSRLTPRFPPTTWRLRRSRRQHRATVRL